MNSISLIITERYDPSILGAVMRHLAAVWLTLLSAQAGLADADSWSKNVEAGTNALNDGRYTDAERSLVRAVKEAEAFGKDDPRLGESQSALARVFLKQGRFVEADRLCQRAQSLLEKARGKDNPAVARCLNLRAEITGALGARHTALKLARQAFDIREKKLGKDHLDTVESLDTLAVYGVGDAYRRELEGLHVVIGPDVWERSLDVRERKLGKDHPDICRSLLVLAVWHRDTAASNGYLNRALAILKKSRREDHPDVAECLTLLARNLGSQEKLKEMEDVQTRALAIWEKLEKEHPHAGKGLFNLAFARMHQNQPAEAERLFGEAVRWHFRRLDDRDLCESFRQAPFKNDLEKADGLTHAEAYLAEMQRRGGPVILKFLHDTHRELLVEERKENSRGSNGNLEVLTVLRRLQKKADPVVINLPGLNYWETVYPVLPEIVASLKNVDLDEKSVGLKWGGDYRTGRYARWRIEVRDAQGKLLPQKPMPSLYDHPLGMIESGGVYGHEVLKPGKSVTARLYLNRYVDVPPGEYTMRVVYHDRVSIADEEHMLGLIVCRSEPVRLLVQPRVIDLTRKERQEIQKWIDNLDEKTSIDMVEGPAPPDVNTDIFRADSPQARLFAVRWKAVPPLLDELHKENLSPGKRAWALALLFSITGHLNPMHENGLLPGYTLKMQSRSLYGGDGLTSFKWGVARGDTGTIDEKKQREFAKRWDAFRDNIAVRERP